MGNKRTRWWPFALLIILAIVGLRRLGCESGDSHEATHSTAADPAAPRLITEPGVGYRLVDPAEPGG